MSKVDLGARVDWPPCHCRSQMADGFVTTEKLRLEGSLRTIRLTVHLGRIARVNAKLSRRPEFSSKRKIDNELALLVGTCDTVVTIIT